MTDNAESAVHIKMRLSAVDSDSEPVSISQTIQNRCSLNKKEADILAEILVLFFGKVHMHLEWIFCMGCGERYGRLLRIGVV